jgi:hypothetical protein
MSGGAEPAEIAKLFSENMEWEIGRYRRSAVDRTTSPTGHQFERDMSAAAWDSRAKVETTLLGSGLQE